MTVLIGVLLFLVLLIPIWAILGSGSGGKNEIPPETGKPEAPEEIISGKRKESNKDVPEKDVKRRRRSDLDDDTDDQIIPDNDFKLPYNNDNIIPEDSPFELYKNTLANAEKYLQKGDFETAKQLFEGLNNRISDEKIREKIDENIDYINNYEQIFSKKKEERKKSATGQHHNEIKVSVDSKDFMPDNIKIDITPPKDNPAFEIDTVVEKITNNLKELYGTAPAAKIPGSEKYETEINKLKNELQELKNVKEEIIKLKEDKLEKDLKAVNEIVEKNNTVYEQDISELKKQINTLRNENIPKPQKETNDDNIQLKNQITQLQNKLEEITTNKTQVEKADEADIKNRSEIDKLKNQIEGLQKKDSEYTERIVKENEILKEKIEKLETKIEPAISDKNVTREIDALKEKLAKIESEKTPVPETANVENELLREELSLLRKVLQENINTKITNNAVPVSSSQESMSVKSNIDKESFDIASSEIAEKLSTIKDELQKITQLKDASEISKPADISEKSKIDKESFDNANAEIAEKLSTIKDELQKITQLKDTSEISEPANNTDTRDLKKESPLTETVDGLKKEIQKMKSTIQELKTDTRENTNTLNNIENNIPKSEQFTNDANKSDEEKKNTTNQKTASAESQKKETASAPQKRNEPDPTVKSFQKKILKMTR